MWVVVIYEQLVATFHLVWSITASSLLVLLVALFYFSFSSSVAMFLWMSNDPELNYVPFPIFSLSLTVTFLQYWMITSLLSILDLRLAFALQHAGWKGW